MLGVCCLSVLLTASYGAILWHLEHKEFPVLAPPHTNGQNATAQNAGIGAHDAYDGPPIDMQVAQRKWLWFRDCLMQSEDPECRPHPSVLLHTPPSLRAYMRAWREAWHALAPIRGITAHSYLNYTGPWVENAFIQAFMSYPAAWWYPVIPLFGQWTDCWAGGARGCTAARRFFMEVADPRMIYVTLVQHAGGTPDIDLRKCAAYANVFVFGGSWGSAAIPILRDEGAPAQTIDVSRGRTYIVSFVGNTSTHPLREQLVASLSNTTLPDAAVYVGMASNWREITADSIFTLAPRGFGRSSYRLAEVSSLGVAVPIYVWDDVPWAAYIPDPRMWGIDGFALHLHHSELADFFCAACVLFTEGNNSSRAEILAMLRPRPSANPCTCTVQKWESLRGPLGLFHVPTTSIAAEMQRRGYKQAAELFSFRGMMQRVRDAMENPGHGDNWLRCLPRPRSVR